MNKDEYITRSKEILEMKLQSEKLNQALGKPCDNYFIEKAETALRWLKE